MKKMKKFLAMLLAMAMVMGLSLTAFAEVSTTKVIVKNTVETNEGVVNKATLTMMRVIKPDTTTETGWTFESTDIATAYKNAFATKIEEKNEEGEVTSVRYENVPTEQQVIWSLILAADESAEVPTGTTAATAGQIEEALSNITVTDGGFTFTVNGAAQEATVSDAGVYAISATQTGYSYSPMAAYVSFGYTDGGVPSSLSAQPVNAKKVDLQVEKSHDSDDDVVFVGDTVTYTITTTVPFIPENVSNVKYDITDVITGAEYVTEEVTTGEGEDAVTTNVVTLNVKVNGGTSQEFTAAVIAGTETGSQTFTVDLSSIASNRNNANLPLEITYDATVTGTIVNNRAVPDDGQNRYQPKTDVVYTGSLTMTKYGEDSETLANAEFVIYTTRNNQTVYAIVDSNNNVTGWTTYLTLPENAPEDAVAASHVKTGADGTVTVKGFDDQETYVFKEVVAPQGYSINTTDATAVWATEGAGAAVATRVGVAEMTDTTLNSLPSTGGIGTTIFTIGGCAIMIIAAGLYFSLRRKSAK